MDWNSIKFVRSCEAQVFAPNSPRTRKQWKQHEQHLYSDHRSFRRFTPQQNAKRARTQRPVARRFVRGVHFRFGARICSRRASKHERSRA